MKIKKLFFSILLVRSTSIRLTQIHKYSTVRRQTTDK